MERYIAIDNVCAWPNLTQLPNGDIVAAIFNKPFHGLWVGDVECWASVDGGRLWSLRGVPAPHEPGTNRMNVAAGVAKNGDLLVIASGWNKRKEHPPKKRVPFEWGSHHRNAEVLVPWVCRSRDGGRTWKRTETVSCEPAGVPTGQATPVPFGDIHIAGPKLLVCSMYFFAGKNQEMKSGMLSGSYCFRSRDDGKTWGEPSLISNQHDETTILCLDKKRWLAAARSDRLDLFVTDDAGEHWRHQEALTSPGEIPAHLLRLRDGRVLLTFGIRHTGFFGIGARISEDQGKTWSSPTKLVDFGDAWDGGYPSSVEMNDGTLVTAYYTPRISQHQRYHMGVILWTVPEAYARNLRKDDEY
jgi:hypothetical protein